MPSGVSIAAPTCISTCPSCMSAPDISPSKPMSTGLSICLLCFLFLNVLAAIVWVVN